MNAAKLFLLVYYVTASTALFAGLPAWEAQIRGSQMISSWPKTSSNLFRSSDLTVLRAGYNKPDNKPKAAFLLLSFGHKTGPAVNLTYWGSAAATHTLTNNFFNLQTQSALAQRGNMINAIEASMAFIGLALTPTGIALALSQVHIYSKYHPNQRNLVSITAGKDGLGAAYSF